MTIRSVITALCLLAVPIACNSASPPDEWKNAVQLADRFRTEWQEVWRALDADATICESIVFPELLRYHQLQDNIELAALLALYVQYGTQAANFSIGVFQMKPSFAEEVEQAWMHSSMRHDYQLYFDLRNTKIQRQKRIERLKDKQWQCVYLAMFVRLMLEREPSWGELDSETRLLLLATAYNYSFTATAEQLRQQMKRKVFHLDLVRTKHTVCYNYSELSLKHYRTFSLH